MIGKYVCKITLFSKIQGGVCSTKMLEKHFKILPMLCTKT